MKSRFIELTLHAVSEDGKVESVLLAADKIASILPKAYGALVSTIEGSGASYMVKETPEGVRRLADEALAGDGRQVLLDPSVGQSGAAGAGE